MIEGSVSDQRQPFVRIIVRGPQGREQTVEALVDSGYNGTLVLPPRVVAALNLPSFRLEKVGLADGSVRRVQSHRGRVLWEGVERPVRVLASGDQPLLGMALLIGYRLCIEMIDGGSVSIEAL